MMHSDASPRERRGNRWAIHLALAVVAAVGWINRVDAEGAKGAGVSPGPAAIGPVGVVAIDPETPTTLYAGNGCSGLFKSSDGGTTWRAINDGLADTAYFMTLTIDPTNPDTLYAGTAPRALPTNVGGMFKSTDGGETWRGAYTGLPTYSGVNALVVDPDNPNTLYVSLYDAGVYRSTDGGGSWRTVLAGMPASLSFAIDPDQPSTVYVGMLGGGVLFKTDNGGGTWRAARTGLPDNVWIRALAINPEVPDTLYAGAETGNVFKSSDGAQTWRAASTGLTSGNDTTLCLAIDPKTPATLYAGTYTGVFKTTNGASTWRPAFTGMNDGVPPAYYPYTPTTYALAVDPETTRTLYAAAEGGLFKSTDGAATWRLTGLGGKPVCGDGIRTCQEACDDGNTASGDGCDADCTVTRCGNGIATVGEECDDGNGDSSDGCTEACTICGNGIVTSRSTISHPGEQCDDGNRSNNDACTNACRRNTCGDGFRNPATEECDYGKGDPFDGCTNACTLCGNGIITPPEECDDHNFSNTDACRNDCKANACGDGFVNPATEECDDGNSLNTDGCRNDCKANVCGDGFVNPATEQCDDGNRNSNDGCTNACLHNLCGDGFVNPASEQCDDGNHNSFDGCTNNCTVCGDGIVTPPEECDDGNTNLFDGCTTACTLCGNGIVTPPEQCDDGNRIDGDACDASCTTTGCGNGRVQGDEGCDDGNTAGGDGCAENCTTESTYPLVLDPNASEIAFQTAFFRVPLQVSGRFTLHLGRPRESVDSESAPVAVRAQDISFAPIPIFDSCVCIRGTENSALGEGISGSGSTSCAGELPGVDVVTSIDHNTNDVDASCGAGFLEDGSADHPHAGVCNGPEEVKFSGTGPVGSMRLDLRLTSWSIPDSCASGSPGDPGKGRDGIPCTDDDPGREASVAQPRGFGGPIYSVPLPPEFELHLTTGVASASILDANNSLGQRIAADWNCESVPCMTQVEGARLNCEELAQGILALKLAGAIAVLDRQPFGDLVATFALSASPPLCSGDCDGGGAVTVDELITGVNIALGNSSVSACDIGDVNHDGQITVDEIITAVSLALDGCL